MPYTRAASRLRLLLPDSSHQTFQKIALDKGLAKLGDIITNLIYSLAKSKVLNSPTGNKVTGKVLANALRESGIRTRLPARLTLHQRSDAAEALIAFFWLNQNLTLNQMTNHLASKLSISDFQSRAAEDRAAVRAFTVLFSKAAVFLPEK